MAWLEGKFGPFAHIPLAAIGWIVAIALGLGLVAGAVLLMPAVTAIEQRDRALVAFAILSGARDGALATFRLKHLDLSARSLFARIKSKAAPGQRRRPHALCGCTTRPDDAAGKRPAGRHCFRCRSACLAAGSGSASRGRAKASARCARQQRAAAAARCAGHNGAKRARRAAPALISPACRYSLPSAIQ